MEKDKLSLKDICEFECRGKEECNCDTFQLTQPEKNRAKFLYITSILLMIGGAILFTLQDVWKTALSGISDIIIAIVGFILIFVIAVNIPLKYHRMCISHKVYWKDIGIPRIQRKYVFMIDVIIVVLPLMFFTWDIIHTIIYIQNGYGINDDIPFMYFLDEFWIWKKWNFVAQGWLDFGFVSVGVFLFVIEVWVWFDHRNANLCTARFDDIPVLSVDEYEERVKKIDGYYWEERLPIKPDQHFVEELFDGELGMARDFERRGER